MRRNDPVPTRDRILDAAQRLFEAQGYNATGVAEILRESGANSGSLYHFFGSKEDLLVAVLRRHVERLDQDVLGPAAGQSEDAVERVLALFDGYRRSLRALATASVTASYIAITSWPSTSTPGME